MAKPRVTPDKKRIALIGMRILQDQSAFNAAITRYAEQQANWEFVFSAEAAVSSFRFLRELNCDGALVRIVDQRMRAEAMRVGFPLINISSWLEDAGVPSVRCDEVMSGRLCARHLLERGLRRFAVLELYGGWFIQQRIQGFVGEIQKAGFGRNITRLKLPRKPGRGTEGNAGESRRLASWLAGQQAPFGLFLSDDYNAELHMEACRRNGLRIPQDVAVIAAYFHPHCANQCTIPLSHVDWAEDKLATLAAQKLDRLMRRGSLGASVTEVPPDGVVALASTDTLAVDDPMVARAVEYLRGRSAGNIKVLTQKLGLQRRTLERRFSEELGISPHQFLLRERVRRAEDILGAGKGVSMEEAARRSGFFDGRHLRKSLRRLGSSLPGGPARS